MISRIGHARPAAPSKGASTPTTSSRTRITTLPAPWGRALPISRRSQPFVASTDAGRAYCSRWARKILGVVP